MRKSRLLQEEKNNNNLLRIFFLSTSQKILGRLVFWNSALKSVAVPMEDKKKIMQMSQIGILKSILW